MLTNDIVSFEQLGPDLMLPYSTPYMSFKIAQMTHMNDDMNPFTFEFLNWTLPSLNMDMSIAAYGMPVRNQHRIANSVDQDDHYELSHLDLHYLQNYLFGLQG